MQLHNQLVLYLQVPQVWNNTTVPFRTDVCIHQLFQQQAAAQPHAECLVFEGNSITYSQLDQKTNRLAHYLQTLGAGRDIPVAVLMERSFDLIVAVMGKRLMMLSFCAIDSPLFLLTMSTCSQLHYICLIMPSLIKSQLNLYQHLRNESSFRSQWSQPDCDLGSSHHYLIQCKQNQTHFCLQQQNINIHTHVLYCRHPQSIDRLSKTVRHTLY